jgi:hypothetical protein
MHEAKEHDEEQNQYEEYQMKDQLQKEISKKDPISQRVRVFSTR